MAKAQPVMGLDAAASSRSSLPVMFAIRISELWGWAEHMPFPHRVRELHDMRIAAKRLRYLFEFFAPCFDPEFKANLKQFKRLQDYLGEIHDCDVWVVYLRRQLRDAFRELNGRRKALKQYAGADPELKHAADELARELANGPVQGLLMMLGDVVERRDRLYGELLEFWAELEQSGFRAKLTQAVAQAASEEPEIQEG